MNGFFYIDKEPNWTSRDVCNKISSLFHVDKVGHIGTLDPFASGLLIVLVGSYTKFNSFISDDDKEYIATLSLGKKTSTGDEQGEVIERKQIAQFNEEDIKKVFSSFIGDYLQLPPMTSAIHVKGRKLYEYAHEGIQVNREKRNVKIYSLDLLSYDNNSITFKTRVSKGTYIRVLGEDIAERLNNVGYLSSLRRTYIGKINVKDAKKIKEISLADLKTDISELINIKKVVVEDKLLKMACNGMTINFEGKIKDDKILLVDSGDKLIAIYKIDHDNYYHCLRGLN